MATLTEIAANAETLLALEPEELAQLVLEYIVEQESRMGTGSPNRYNFSMSFSEHSKDVQNALMEAWAWLETSGAIAQMPQQHDGWFFVTRRGHELARTSATAVLTREQILPRRLLHPRIEQRVWSAFLRGEYDSAVFEAFKQVEVAIREACRYDNTEIGVTLVRKAFHPETGPLTDKNAVPSERQALSDLFAGALGSYKNPHSHRNVAINEASEAAEMVTLASHLLKIVDSRAKSTGVSS